MAELETRTVPDPSTLTTEQLERAVANLKDLLHAEVSGIEAVISERFESIRAQLDLIERQRLEQKTDTRTAVDAALTAVDAALAAAKEAVGKSEVSTKEQLGAMRAETTAALKTVTEAAGDLKERIVAMESMKLGNIEQRDQQHASVAQIAAIIGTVGALLGIIIVLANVLTGGP